MADEVPASEGPGRRRIEFDLEQVEGLGRIGATFDEIATVLKCSKDTVRRRMRETEQDDDGNEVPGAFRLAYLAGRANLTMQLRRRQVQAALQGNTTMMIWLGKQLLDQADESRIAHKLDGQATVELKQLREMSDADLDTLARERGLIEE